MNILDFVMIISGGNLDRLKEKFTKDLIEKRYTGRTCLHYACYYNNPRVVEYLINEGCDIEAISTSPGWDGYRPIHIAARCGNTDNAIALINAGCDLECVNKDGQTPYILAINEYKVKCAGILIEAMNNTSNLPLESNWKKRTFFKNSNKLEFLVPLNDYIFSNGKINLEIKVEVDRLFDDDFHKTLTEEEAYFILLFKTLDDNGSTNKHEGLKIGDQIIEINGVSMLCRSKEEMMTKLINIIERAQDSGNDVLNVVVLRKSNEGYNPCPYIDVEKTKLIQKVHHWTAKLEEEVNTCLSNILIIKTANETFNKFWNTKDSKVMETIRNKPIDKKEINEWFTLKEFKIHIQSYDWIHECLLYRCMKHNYQEGFITLCTPDIVNKETLLLEFTAIETAVQFKSVFCVDRILKMLEKIDDSWARAEKAAKDNDLKHLLSLIVDRRMYLNQKNKEGYNRLHMAVFDDDSTMVEYILRTKIIDPDEDRKKVGTALSLAYSLGNVKCIECLQNYGVSVNTFDKMNQSPLHFAIYNRIEEYSDYLVNNTTDIEVEDYMGFTVLERSVMNDCGYICEKLVRKGVKCDKYVQLDSRLLRKDVDLGFLFHNTPHLSLTSQETICTMCFKLNKLVYPCLLESLEADTVNLTDESGNTLLHLSVRSLCLEMCEELMLKSANVDCLNNGKNTPLLELLVYDCSMRMQNERNFTEDLSAKDNLDLKMVIAEILIDHGASVNVENEAGVTVLSAASEYYNEELLLLLIKNKEHLKSVNEPQWSFWFNMGYYTFLKEVIPIMNKSTLSEWITDDLIVTQLYLSDLCFIKVLYELASCSTKVKVVESILLHLAEKGELDFFKDVIDQDILPETYSEEETFLMSFLINKKLFDFCKIIIRSNNASFFLGKKNLEMKLPLHIFIESQYWDILDHVIADTKYVDEEDNDGNTPLSLLLKKLSKTPDESLCDRLMGFVKMLIRRKADIYKVNKHGKITITFCTEANLKVRIISLNERYGESLGNSCKERKVCSACKHEL